MITNKIKIGEEDEAYDRKEIALAIRNWTYNDKLKCSLIDQNIIKDCEICSLKFICDGIYGLVYSISSIKIFQFHIYYKLVDFH